MPPETHERLRALRQAFPALLEWAGVVSLERHKNLHEAMNTLLLRVRRDPSNDKVISMPESALRFFPLFDQREPNGEIRFNAHAQQCLNHAINNMLDPCLVLLDLEHLNRIVQLVKCLKSQFVEDELLTAMNQFFGDRPADREIDNSTDFFKKARKGVEDQALAGKGITLDQAKLEIGWNDKIGAEKAETCAIVRWSTTTKSGDWTATWRRAYAVGFLRTSAVALDPKDEVKAVVSVFSHEGFRSENFQDLMLEKKVAESFEFLTGSRTLFQLFLVAFLHRFIFEPLMALTSADKECGDLTGGAAGIPRRMLAALRRALFVAVGGTWSRRLAHAHRTNGAEFKLSRGSVRLLNPKCGDKVSSMLGDDWDGDPILAAIRRGMVEAGPQMLDRFRQLARKTDPIMPQDTLRIVCEMPGMKALLADSNSETSVALRMLQMQFVARHVIEDTAVSLANAVRHGLDGLRQFVAGMSRLSWTDSMVSCMVSSPTGELCPTARRICYAHPFALADGVVTLKMIEEMTHALSEQIEKRKTKMPLLDGKDPLDFLPAYVGETFRAGPAIQEWLGVSTASLSPWGDHHNRVVSIRLTTTGWRAHYNTVASIKSATDKLWISGATFDSNGEHVQYVRLRRRRVAHINAERQKDLESEPVVLGQALHRGFYPWWLRRMENASIFRTYWNQIAELPKPVQMFPAAYAPSRKAANFAPSSKGMEQHWSFPALMFDTRSSLSNPTLSNYYILPAFRDPELSPESLMASMPQHVVDAAHEMAQFQRLQATYQVDQDKRSVMKEDAHRRMAEKALRSRCSGWSTGEL